MQVCIFRKKEEGTFLLFEQRNNGKAIQDIFLSCRKILSNSRKMSNEQESSRTEEEKGFKFVILDSLLSMKRRSWETPLESTEEEVVTLTNRPSKLWTKRMNVTSRGLFEEILGQEEEHHDEFTKLIEIYKPIY